MKPSTKGNQLSIRPYASADGEPVRELFIIVNRGLAPDHLKEAFEDYIERSLKEEIDCILEYYALRKGSFWVAEIDKKIIGMLGLEQYRDKGMELRRMYVAPQSRRQGIAGRLLEFAENQARADGAHHLYLSTSELQQAAVSLYQNSGYRLIKEETAENASNKTIGGGIRRFHFMKEFST